VNFDLKLQFMKKIICTTVILFLVNALIAQSLDNQSVEKKYL